MLKIVLALILLPFIIGIGTFISQFLSMLMIYISVGLGGFVHKLFAGKKETSWHAPSYITVVQVLIIMGFIYAVTASIIGSYFGWGWLESIGQAMNRFFGIAILIDMFILMVLATIHGPFDVLGE